MKNIIFIISLIACCYPKLFAQQTDSLSAINNILTKSCLKEKMSRDEMNMFVFLYTDSFTNNIELCEFRNEALFAIMNSDNLDLFLSTLKNQKSHIPRILYDLAHPLHDTVNADSCIYRLKYLNNIGNLEKQILNILRTLK